MVFVQFRKVLALAVILAFAAAVTASSATAEAITTTEREIVPFATTASGCVGEDVFLSGELLLISHTTFDASGGGHSKVTLVPKNVRGVGSVSGTQYKAVGGSRSHFISTSSSALSFSITDMFNFISATSIDNMQVKFTFHVTLNANGIQTALVENFSAKCVG